MIEVIRKEIERRAYQNILKIKRYRPIDSTAQHLALMMAINSYLTEAAEYSAFDYNSETTRPLHKLSNELPTLGWIAYFNGKRYNIYLKRDELIIWAD